MTRSFSLFVLLVLASTCTGKSEAPTFDAVMASMLMDAANATPDATEAGDPGGDAIDSSLKGEHDGGHDPGDMDAGRLGDVSTGDASGVTCVDDSQCEASEICDYGLEECPLPSPGDHVSRSYSRIPGICLPTACGARSCVGFVCHSSKDCARGESCGIKTPDTCDFGPFCNLLPSQCPQGCKVSYSPGTTSCGSCLCPHC